MSYYNFIAPSYNELYGEEQAKKLNIIKKCLKINKATKILDVGCGTGASSNFDCIVVGIDPSIELLKQNNNGSRIAGIAEMLPFKDNTFDYVISVTAMHNFKDIKNSIAEIIRVGKQNFVVTILKKSNKFGLIRQLIEKNFKIYNKIVESRDVIYLCRK